MKDPDYLAAFLHRHVGEDLELTPEDYAAAIVWLQDDPVGKSCLNAGGSHAVQEEARLTRERARATRQAAQNLRAAGTTRRLLK